MISWCSAGQRLSTALRVAIYTVPRRSAFIRPLPISRAVQTRAPLICGAAPSTKQKSRNSAQSSRPSQVPKKAAQDSFYAPEAVTFPSLGASAAVANALQQAGFTRPSTVQVLETAALSLRTRTPLCYTWAQWSPSTCPMCCYSGTSSASAS